MNSDGLKKIYLIKSAGYEFSEIDIRNNTLLLGESGVGKTTIMRAVLFFYTMDYSDATLNLTSDTKKSFNDWYFKEYNSHIVYEYTREGSRFWFVVSKSSKLNYTFIDVTNTPLEVKEFFIEQNKPINLEQLNEKVQQASLPNYHTAIKDRYINTLHKRDANSKKIKQESVVDFSLFESVKYTKEYAKTLSNIFMASKVNSSSIKKSIVSLVQNNDVKIDLNEIRVNLDEYVKHKDEIDRFEMKIPNIKELSSKYESYNSSRKNFKLKANEIESCYQSASQKLQEFSVKIQKVMDEEDTLNSHFKVKVLKLDEEFNASSTKVIEQEKDLRELRQKDEEYRAKHIDTLVLEYENETSYVSRLAVAQNRYKALTSEYETLSAKYQDIIKKLQEESSLSIIALQNKNIDIKSDIDAKKIALIESKEINEREKTQKYVDEKTKLVLELEELSGEINSINLKLAEIKHFVFNSQEIGKCEDEIKSYEKALMDNKRSLDETGFEIKSVEQDIAEIQKAFKDSSSRLDKDSAEKKEKLFEQKTLLDKKLNVDAQNLYSYIHKSDLQHKEKILTYLKDEILFSDTKFVATKGADTQSIFGLSVEFEEKFADKYEYSKLLNELKFIKDKIKQVNQDSVRMKKSLEDEASKDTKEKNRQRSSLYSKKDKLEVNLKSYAKNQSLSKLNLQKAHDDARELKKQKNDELNKDYATTKLKQDECKKLVESLSVKIQEIKEVIGEGVRVQVAQYNLLIKSNAQTLEANKKELKDKYAHKIQDTQKELSDALKNNGVDEVLLDEISQEVQNLKTKLLEIENARNIVITYLEAYKWKIENIPSLTQTLREDSENLAELNSAKGKLQELHKEEELQFLEIKQKLNHNKSAIKKFIQNYDAKIQNQNIHKSIKRVLTIDAYEVADDILIDADMVDNIIKLYEDVQNIQNSIESAVLKILQNLKHDNIFKIEIPSDNIEDKSYLRMAKELIENIENDKLSILKDASLDKFKSNIVLIRKQLGSFDEALSDVNQEINYLSSAIKKAVHSFKVIDNISIRFTQTNNNVLNTLKDLSEFYDKNSDKFLSGLFDSGFEDKTTQALKEKLREQIVGLVKLLNTAKEYLELEDGFVLEFKVVERGNDLAWRQTLNDIGSNGTSTLVKSIINISMLKMVSKNIVKNNKITTHCILDEIGTISTEYFRELKDFVNDNGFIFLNGMPTEDDMLMSMYPTIYVGQNFGEYSKMILASKVDI